MNKMMLKKISAILLGGFICICSSKTNTMAEITLMNTTTAGVSNFLTKIDFSKPVEPTVEPEQKIVVEEPQTRMINGFEISKTRFDLIEAATDMVGTVSYHLGSKPDYENNWTVGDSLDCSGFVEYIYYIVTGYDIGQGTWNQSTDNVETGKGIYISHDELKPGDLAFRYDGRDTITYDEDGNQVILMNHVGIYLGKDDDGNDLWCHCNASDNTVSINSVSYWTKYERLTCIDLD